MKISIFWVWHVWLVTWICLAEIWNQVIFYDIDKDKIMNLQKWILDIYEPHLNYLLSKNINKWFIEFTTDIRDCINFWDVIFSTVWTFKNWQTNLSWVFNVAKKFGKYIKSYKIFINKSTVPTWTWDKCFQIISKEIKKRNKNIKFDVVSNPEFLREWTAVFDFMEPDRIIYGTNNKKTLSIMRKIYLPFKIRRVNIIETDLKTAEIIKYISNIFLGLKISFINEIANFSEIIWVNINDISRWIWSDKRIWKDFLQAWIWYWWSCFSKDINSFIKQWKNNNFNFKILPNIEIVNKKQKLIIVDKLLKHIKNLNWKIISIWWLSYKENTDDTRFSPSINIINKLLDLWVKEIKAFDPVANRNMQKIYINEKKLSFYNDKYDALKDSNCLLLLTPWKEFHNLDYEIMSENMENKLIIDWRNFLNKKKIKDNNFIYEWIWIN